MVMARRFLSQIYRWRVPPNWSPRDWFEEMEAEIIAAAWEAERDFDLTRGVPLEAFVHQRVMARALTRYRREWAYSRRCGYLLECGDCEGVTADGFSSIEDPESLRSCLRRLSKPQRLLIEYLYWEGKTVVQVARMLSLSQPAISRRKQRALDQLRRWMDRPEKEKRDFPED
jgi:RNA polymerase sigma factor (sigma-70 family)